MIEEIKNLEIHIHYNIFDTIEGQLNRYGYKCKYINIYEKCKDNLFFLYIHNILTDVELDKKIKKLNKIIIKNCVKI